MARFENLSVTHLSVREVSLGGGGYVSHLHDFTVDENTSGSHAIFTITGDVRIRLLPICTTDLVGHGASAKLSLGYNGAVTSLCANTTASGLDSGEQWTSSAAATLLGIRNLSTMFDVLVSNKTSIKMVVNSVSMSSGKIMFHCWWEPLSTNAKVTET